MHLRFLLYAALFLVALGALPGSVFGAPVTILEGHSARTYNDPFLPTRASLREPHYTPPHATPVATAASGPTVEKAMADLVATGQLTQAEYDQYFAKLEAAKAAYKTLKGTRRKELGAVIKNLKTIAASKLLIPSRLKPLFITLDRNVQWWKTGPLLNYGQRVTFPTTKLIFQYYPGQGIQLQMLANWSRVNQYWQAGSYYSAKFNTQLQQILDELVPLAAVRAGGIAWEYYFKFDIGKPPWTSSISQGTAIQALSRSAIRLSNNEYFNVARQALGIFKTPPPEGVMLKVKPGRVHYLIYSYSKKQRVLNAFIQSLVGLYDFAKLANDAEGMQLFKLGDTEAQIEVPKYDTGTWSLYQPGKRSDVGYHTLLRDFLKNLCERTTTPVYCKTADRFTSYLHSAV